MQNSQDTVTFSPPSLLCQEESHEHDDEEYVEMLLQKEINGNAVQKQERGYNSTWIKGARLDAIRYIFNTNESFGFKIQTAYLAITYLDKFLSRRLIEDEKYWAIKLLAVACLSLAAKVEECRVPLLSEFPGEDYNFEGKVIMRMELLILNTLNWKLQIATPYTFIQYFVLKLGENNQMRDTVSEVFEIISIAIRNMNLIQCRASTIAAAATLLMLDQRLTRESLELKINSLSCSALLNIEEIILFYNRMKELDTSNSIKSPPSLPIQLQRTTMTDVLENSSITSSGVSAKRKSLNFTDKSDQDITLPDHKRQC